MKAFLHLYNIIIIIFLVWCPTILLGQDEGNQTPDNSGWTTISQAELAYLEDSSRTLTLKEAREKEFTPGQTENFNFQSIYWYRFYLHDIMKKQQLFLQFGFSDFSDVYIPIKNKDEYQHYVVGNFAKRKKTIVTSSQFQILSLKTSDIDFSKPIYFNKSVITQWSKDSWRNLPSFLFAEDDTFLDRDMLQIRYYYRDVPFYIGIVFISFFLFLVNFFISKNKSYLIYGLYLLGVGIYYVNRQPLFLNFYQKTIPELYFYVNQLAYIANIGCYTWFVFYFLDFEHAFPKVYKFTRRLLLGILAFGILYGIQIILFPYFQFRFLVMDIFRLTIMLLSVGLFIYLMFQKPDNIAKIVLVGSLVLIAGNALSIILGDFTIFLKLMVLEIILFSIVVALRNKEIDNKRIRNRYDLEVEKMKIKTKEELDSTKARFYENITHEFRTPLTLILSPIERKLSKATLSHQERKELNLIQRNANRLLYLVNQLLDLVKLEEGKLQLHVKKGNLSTFLHPMIYTFQKEALDKNIRFIKNIQNIKTAWFDPDVLETVFTNILSNTLKYTPKYGTIKIESYTKNGYWYFVITNTTNPEVFIDVSKLFTRYYRAEQQTYGAGIGLNIVKELIQLTRGNIKVKTLQNNDLQIIISLPIEKYFFTENNIENIFIEEATKTNNTDNIAVVGIKEAKLETPKNKHKPKGLPQLLIVEDNLDMREFIISNFEEEYQIYEADNGELGIDLAQKYLPDLIISDIIMPEKNGFELCDGIKQNLITSHIPVILLTAKVGEENEIQGFKTGADAYITKPFNTEKLKIRTKQLIDAQKRLAEHYRNTFSINPNLAITDTEAKFLERLKSVVEENITNSNFDNESFSHLMQMSQRQLHRKLKSIIGMTPTEFVRNERIKLAAELLIKSNATVAEIAYQVGFNTPSYFIKCFKKVYGYTPKEFSENS